MSFQRLRTHLKSIQVEEHIIAGRKGNKENIKSKVIIPILQTIGWNLLRDMDFDHQGLDIVLFKEKNPCIIVEVKSWTDVLEEDINQYLEYSFRLNCPWIFLSTGQHMAMYCTLLNQQSLSGAEPILRFTLEDLVGGNGNKVLGKLDRMMGKKHFFKKNSALYDYVSQRLPNQSIEEAQIEFVKNAAQYVREERTRQLTVESFLSQLRHHSRQVSGALVYLHSKMVNVLQLNNRLNLRYRNKGVGLEYETIGNPQGETLNLFDIYPESARITFGQDGWKKLNITAATFDDMKHVPRKAHSFAWARDV
ncbi:MAG: type I restriction enzyme HsdR N-terminal domain-containing protein, partial [Desulfobacterales bacterium]